MEFLKDVTRELVFGIIILFIGLALCWFVIRRRINRRGAGGLQLYSNPEIGCLTTIFECVLMLLGIAGIGLGGFMMAVELLL